MKNSLFLLSLLIITGALVTGCVSPYYGTARIEPEPDINAGIAYTTGITAWPSSVQGIRVDIYAGQGFNRYLKPYVRASIGVGYETYDYGRTDKNGFRPIFDAGVGLHCALDLKYVTPALVVELSPYMFTSLSTAMMLGLGKPEILTLGIRPHIVSRSVSDYIPVDVFASIHLFKRLTLFTGIEITSISNNEPWVGVGLGYSLY